MLLIVAVCVGGWSRGCSVLIVGRCAVSLWIKTWIGSIWGINGMSLLGFISFLKQCRRDDVNHILYNSYAVCWDVFKIAE